MRDLKERLTPVPFFMQGPTPKRDVVDEGLERGAVFCGGTFHVVRVDLN